MQSTHWLRLVLPLCLAIWLAPQARADDPPKPVPDVVGRAAAEAAAVVEAAGFKATTVEIAAGIPGKVHSQVPAADALRPVGSEVELRVGTALRVQTETPDVRGKPLAEVMDAVGSVYVVEIERVDGDPADEGKVLDQEPQPGEPLLFRGVFRLTAVQEATPAGVIVPSVLGLPEAEARAMIDDAGLSVAVSYVQDPVAGPGVVISQEPACCGEILAGGLVSLRVNGEPPPAEPGEQVAVPAVAGMTMHDASHAVLMADLVPLVSFRVDLGADAWRTLEQDPAAGTLLDAGAQVRLVISLPDPKPAQVRVPPLYGLSAADAAAVLQLLGLQAQISEQFSLNPPGRVFGQTPASGAYTSAGATVHVRVAQVPPGGWQPHALQVPSVLGLTPIQAFVKLLASGLWGHEKRHVSPGAQLGRIDAQHPAAGALVGPGTGVRFYLPKTTTVPPLVGSSKASALQKLLQAGLNGSAQGPAFGFGGTKVTGQSVAAGTQVAEGETIHFTYKYLGGIGPLKVKVPSLLGKTKGQAAALLQAKGLNGQFNGPPFGIGGTKITAQNPAPNLLVPVGTTVTAQYVFVGGPPALQVPVPDVLGKTKGQATFLLQAKGLHPQFVGPAFGLGITKVTSQNPGPGTLVAPGTNVVVHYVFAGGLQPFKVKVPLLIGKTKAQAGAALQAVGLGATFVGPGPGFGLAKVVSQNPGVNVLVSAGTSVTVKLQYVGGGIGVKVAVPNLLGKTKAQALAALQAKGLAASFSGPQFGFGTTKVVGQNPNPGVLVNPGSAVNVTYVFAGPGVVFLKVAVPNVVGKTKGQAQAALLAAGLQVNFVQLPGGFGLPKAISQNPHAGTLVSKGSTVTVVLKK